MTMTTIPQIDFEIDGDNLTIKQDLGFGEIATVYLHRVHLSHIAGELGVPVLSASAEAILRKFKVVTDRLNRFAETESYRSEVIKRCGIGFELFAELDGICELASDFLEDFN
ncbi:MAG: hypothetical protein CTY12_02980 [Methylotenera sp.]|nr:MAG: hypothetical protein CTY12_02980 [Methylotenera sp.]